MLPGVWVFSAGKQAVDEGEVQWAGKPRLRRLDACLEYFLSKSNADISQFERPLRTVFFSFLGLIIAVFSVSIIVSEYRNLREPQDLIVETAERLLTRQKAFGAELLDRTVNTISGNEALLDAIREPDLEKIRQAAERVLATRPGDVEVAEFTIYAADRKPLYSSNTLVAAGKPNNVFRTDLKASLSRKTNDIEFGPDNRVIVSILKPWISDGKLLGYLKLAIDIERSLSVASSAVEAQIVKIYVFRQPEGEAGDRVRYKVLGNPSASDFNFDVITSRTGEIGNLDRFHLQKRNIFMVRELPIPTIKQNEEVKLILVKDITGDVWAFLKETLLSLAAGAGVALLAWAVIRRLLSRLQSSVHQTRRRLENEVQDNVQKLERSALQLLEAQRIASVGSWERDIATGQIHGSEEFFRITNIPQDLPSPEVRKLLFSRVPLHEHEHNLAVVNAAVERCGEFEFEHSFILDDGETRYLHVRGYVTAGPDGKAAKVFGIIHDVTDRRNAESQNHLLANILESSLNEIYILDAETFRVEYANQCAIDNLGYETDELKSRKIWDINPAYDQQTVHEHFSSLMKGHQESLSIESLHRRKDGSEYPVDLRIQFLKQHDRSLFVAIANDVSERVQRENETREAKNRAERLAYFDTLTKLSNRAGCQRDAKLCFAKADKPSFLIHVDMDGFKRVNDTLGHLAGDYCLEETGRRLREVCRDLGTAYRWGGDEFVILAESSSSDVNELCERARRLMRQPMEFNGNRFWPTVSMGIALCPEDADEFEALLVNADLALYQSKESGKDRYTFFKPDMKAESETEARIELELHDAVKNDQFFLVYQPQVNLRSQATTGVEALVRWQHPERGVLPPGEFLPVVEKSSLAPVLGEMVIDKAIAAARSWLDAGLDFGRISVNVSPAHLASGQLVGHFKSAMDKYGIGPERVTAEVLESVFLNDNRTGHLEALKELFDLGVHIELDDFGTGYASLTHVADLPINGLKIDRSFTRQMLQDPRKEAVVNQLIHLARSLNIGIVCEGVETEAQYDRLRMMGDFSIQGYLIAKPMPFDQATNWMTESSDDLYFVL